MASRRQSNREDFAALPSSVVGAGRSPTRRVSAMAHSTPVGPSAPAGQAARDQFGQSALSAASAASSALVSLSANSAMMSSPTGGIRLRVAGLGHHFELDADPASTLGELKEEIERRIDLPAGYQRLVAKRKRMDDDACVLGPTIMEGNTIVSMGIGLEDRTKILLLHSAQYEADKEGIKKLDDLNAEIERVDKGRRSRDMKNKLVQELVIQICCKIDGVETHGSAPLRTMRKLTVKKAEEVARKSEEDVRGVDP